MKFEVINNKNKVVNHTEYISRIPDIDTIESMIAAGYKFKIDNKILTKNQIVDFVKNNKEK